jgi:hypothetical protein
MRQRLVVNFTPRPLYLLEITPLPIEQRCGWAPESVRSLWSKEKSFAPTGIQTMIIHPMPSHCADHAVAAYCSSSLPVCLVSRQKCTLANWLF